MAYQHFEAKPITPAIGAELIGLDLGQPLSDEAFAELKTAIHKHLVVFFRNQSMGAEDHMGLASRLGEMERHEILQPHPEHPVISVLEHDADRPPISDVWHTDVSYRERPSMFSVLYARVVPELGGDTLWRSAYAAFETLPKALKNAIDDLEAEHDILKGYANFLLEKEGGRERYLRIQAESPPVVHPVVATHPVTGRELLYVNPTFTRRIIGMPESESAALLDLLYRHYERPEFHVRWRWAADDVAIWDNRATQHYATGDYYPNYRRMHRITIAGDRPARTRRQRSITAAAA
jgi:taurine dioxygenase